MDISEYIEATSLARPSEKPKGTVKPLPTLEKRDDIKPIESRLIPMVHPVSRPAQVTSLFSPSSIPRPASLSPTDETLENLLKESEIASSMTSVPHHPINPRKRRRNHHQIGLPDEQKKRQKKPMSPEDYKWSLPHGQLLPQTPENPDSADILAPLSSRISATDLRKIRKRDKKTQRAVLQYFNELTTLGFTSHQIIRIAARNGGSRNLQAFLDEYPSLLKSGFSLDQIIRMASYAGGSKNIATVIRYRKELELLELHPDEIVRMVSHNGGSKNLQSFITSREALIQSGFSPEQIFNLAAWPSGSNNIKAVVENFNFLRTMDFTHDQIVRLAACPSGSLNIAYVKAHAKNFRKYKLTPALILGLRNKHQRLGIQAIQQALQFRPMRPEVKKNLDQFLQNLSQRPETEEKKQEIKSTHISPTEETLEEEKLELEEDFTQELDSWLKLWSEEEAIIEKHKTDLQAGQQRFGVFPAPTPSPPPTPQKSSEKPKGTVQPLLTLEKGPASLSPNSPAKDIAYETEKLIEKIKQIGKTYIEKVYTEIKIEKIALMEKVFYAMKKNKLYARKYLSHHLKKILKENTAGFNQEEYLKALLGHDIPDVVRPFNLFFQLMQTNSNVSLMIRDIWLDWLSQPTDPVYKSLLSQVIRITDPRNKKSLLEWSSNTDSTKARHIKAWIKKILPNETFENLPEESDLSSPISVDTEEDIQAFPSRISHTDIKLTPKTHSSRPLTSNLINDITDENRELPEDETFENSPEESEISSSMISTLWVETKKTPYLPPLFPDLSEISQTEINMTTETDLSRPLTSNLTNDITDETGSAAILAPLSSRISTTDLIKIRKRGKKDQWAVLRYFNELTTLGFTSHQIIRIAVRNGGANNLEAIPRHFSQLTELGFTIIQIVQMVNHTGGSLNLAAVCQDFQQFRVFGFTHAQLVRIVGQDGGSINLQKVKDFFGSLSLSHLGHEIIVSMAAHIGGSENLQAFLDESPSLGKSGFSLDQIIWMASHNGGSKNLKAVIHHFDTLRQWGFTHDQIAKIASNNGGSKTIETVIGHYKELELLKLGPDKIVQLVSYTGGSKNLLSFMASREALIQSGFSPEQIFNLAAWRSGSKNIQAVVEDFNFLRTMDFTHDQIVRLAACRSGSLNIADVKAHAENFRKYKFTPALILGLKNTYQRVGIQAIQRALQSHPMRPEVKQNLDQFLQNLSQRPETEEKKQEIKSTHISPTKETLEEDFTQELDSWLKLWSEEEAVIEKNKTDLQAGRQRFGMIPTPSPTPQKSQEATPESPAPGFGLFSDISLNYSP